MRLIEALCSSINEESQLWGLPEISAVLNVRAGILSQVFWIADPGVFNPDTFDCSILMEVQTYEFSIIIIPILQMKKLRPRWRDLSQARQWDQWSNKFEPLSLAEIEILCKLWSFSSVWEGDPFSDLMLRLVEQLAFCDWAPIAFPEL